MLTREEVADIADAGQAHGLRPGQAVFNYLVRETGGRRWMPEDGNWGALFYRCRTVSETVAELARHGLLVPS